jgi:hypothetical protein
MTDTNTNTVARTLHDIGLAAWFGGSLMGAIGLNGASGRVSDPRERTAVANAGWAKWTPVNAAAIGMHLLAGAQLLRANSGRVAAQQGVASASTLKAVLTLIALAATGWSRILGQKVIAAEAEPRPEAATGQGPPADDGVTPAAGTPEGVAMAQRQLKVLQWVVPGVTGSILLVNARMGEQQRPASVSSGILGRLGRSS